MVLILWDQSIIWENILFSSCPDLKALSGREIDCDHTVWVKRRGDHDELINLILQDFKTLTSTTHMLAHTE